MSLRKIFTAFLFNVSLSSLIALPVKVEDLKPAKNLPKDRPSVALVLAGGGAKGFAELPIMEYIDQLDIPIDMIVGTSVGAIVGGFYSAGYSALEIVNEFSHVDWTPYFTDTAVSPYEEVYGIHGKNSNLLSVNFDNHLSMNLGKAVSNGQLAYQLFRKMLIKYPSNKSFDDLPIPFRAVATDMLNGDAIVLQDGDLAEAIRASMSLPGVFEPLNIDGYYFTDGGIRYNLPINVAKAMGYDIVIAIDVSATVLDDPNAYSNPAVSLMNALTIAEQANTYPLLNQADLIIVPNYKGFGTLDFSKSKEIYEAGKSNLEDYKEALENIRKRIYPKDYDKNGNRISEYKLPREKGEYHNRDYFVPAGVICEGAVNKDIDYITDAFNKIADKNLTTQNFDSFLNTLYLTGNYNSIHTRLMDTEDGQYIRLQMKPKPSKEIKLLLNADMEQTYTDSSTTRTNLEIDFQARGFTGIGSMLSLHGTFLTDYGCELYYMQPFNPYFFIENSIGIFDEIYPQKADDVETFSNVIGFTNFYTKLNLGIRTPNSNLAKLGFSYNGIFPKYLSYISDPYLIKLIPFDNITEIESNNRIYGHYLRADFITNFGTLNSMTLPTSGYYISPKIKFVIPFGKEYLMAPIFIGEIELRGAASLTPKISLSSSVKIGSDFTSGLLKYYPIIPYEGFSTYDRLYFPSITSKNHFGTKMLATRMAFTFKPKERLTILGGEMQFRIEGTAGIVNYDWKDSYSQFSDPLSDFPIIWSGTVGIGVKGNKNCNGLIRIGACSTHTSNFAILLCFDVGNLMF